MEIKALSTFTAFDEGRMKVFNAGDQGEVSDKLAADYIAAGLAEEAERKPAKARGKAKVDHLEPGDPVPDEADDAAPAD